VAEGGAGAELDVIMGDLDATTAAWAAAGYPFDGPRADAREAVFARLHAWNVAREHFHGCPTPSGRPFDCDYCQQRSASMAADRG
jgi:hypothetical protein